MAGKKQFSTFVVDRLLFGVEVEKVQEVIRYQAMTRVPLAPPVVRGLINLRGQIVTAVDLRCRLGLRPRATADLPMNVVIRHDDGAHVFFFHLPHGGHDWVRGTDRHYLATELFAEVHCFESFILVVRSAVSSGGIRR